jgi:hypothetical protein
MPEALARARRAVARTRKSNPPPKREYVGRPYFIKYRVTADEWKEARFMAAARGWPNLSSYLRALVAEDVALLYEAEVLDKKAPGK